MANIDEIASAIGATKKRDEDKVASWFGTVVSTSPLRVAPLGSYVGIECVELSSFSVGDSAFVIVDKHGTPAAIRRGGIDGSSLNSLSVGTLYVPSMAGTIMQYAGTTAPPGWLICNGAAVSRETFSELFSVIGTRFGAGNGSTTFNIPDMRGSFALGVSSSHALGSTGGAETHTLTANEIPSHNHSVLLEGQGSSSSGIKFTGSGASGGQFAGSYIGSTGGGQAHNNMPPYVSLNYIICIGSDNKYIVFDVNVATGVLSYDDSNAPGVTAALDSRGHLMITEE